MMASIVDSIVHFPALSRAFMAVMWTSLDEMVGMAAESSNYECVCLSVLCAPHIGTKRRGCVLPAVQPAIESRQAASMVSPCTVVHQACSMV